MARAATDPVYGALVLAIIGLPLAGFLLTALHRAAPGAERVLDPGRGGGRCRGSRPMVVIAAALGGTFGEEGLARRPVAVGARPATFVVEIGFFVDNLTRRRC